jgi:hypothetical protein
MDDLCQFSLIFPKWLGPTLAIAGVVLTILAIVIRIRFRTAAAAPDDAVNIELGPVTFGIGWLTALTLITILFALLGIVCVAAVDYQPFGRWIGSRIESLVDKKDAEVSGDFNNEPLSGIESNLGYSGYYVVHLSNAAKQEKLNRTYEGRCYAELINNICRQESQQFECKIDANKRTIDVCKRSGDPDCAH